MNCTEFKDIIDDVLVAQRGDSLVGREVEQRAAFDAHRASCGACQTLYASETALVDALRAMPVPEPSSGFADRVLARAVEQAQKTEGTLSHQHHHRRGFVLGFGSAAAAALAMWVVVGMFPGETPKGTDPAQQTVASVTKSGQVAKQPQSDNKQPELSIALNKQQNIKLAFYSGEPLDGAKITIRLPENVALVGYPGRRQLSWETSLKKGDNLLSLPVIATQVARGELVADIEYQGRVKTLKVNLETSSAGASSVGAKLKPLVG